ncbi:hypothetical protein D9758_010661 [Tetrapyrgos nigripes]|uniref:Tyr recombinase domain-containing protein n=1 Tax=Tetrapyrgos nigripes TaxID=182062 RepID=A0A8H5LP71_9AGAR|nr:hypothetical protein D9758_010661 [Tetrapyrgos nigripes]
MKPLLGNKYGALNVFLPSIKTAGDRDDHAHITPWPHVLNATKAAHRHVKDNDLSQSDPFTAYRDEHGDIKVLTRSKFMAMCNRIWTREEYGRFTGHSFHIGRTTFLLSNGVDTETVKRCGRWKSSAFTRYWQDLHTISKVHIDRVHAHCNLSH